MEASPWELVGWGSQGREPLAADRASIRQLAVPPEGSLRYGFRTFRDQDLHLSLGWRFSGKSIACRKQKGGSEFRKIASSRPGQVFRIGQIGDFGLNRAIQANFPTYLKLKVVMLVSRNA